MNYWNTGIHPTCQQIRKFVAYNEKKTVVAAYEDICTDCAIFDNSEAASMEHDETAH